MKILLVSKELIAGNLALILKSEGHSVKLYIKDKGRRHSLKNLVPHEDDWENAISWVSKEGLIVFDDVGFGDEQNSLRQRGYTVFGGSKIGDKLEQDRSFGSKIMNSCGMETIPVFDFKNSKNALAFVKKNVGPWVIKQNSHHYSKALSYVGHFKDGRDIVDVLERYNKHFFFSKESISLQKRIDGVEIAVSRFFNGNNWVGPICINVEHPLLFPGNIGPLTSEMGTLVWYTQKSKIFDLTLGKMESYLKKIDYRGIIDINCIATKSNVCPIEITARFGSPIIHALSSLHNTKWSDILHGIAEGKDFIFKTKLDTYSIVTLVASPPFPYSTEDLAKSVVFGSNIYFKTNKSEFKNIHLEEVSYDKKNNQYYISDICGYILYVTSVSKTILAANKKVMSIIHKIFFPKMFYRNDIGLDFENKNKKKLQRWGYL